MLFINNKIVSMELNLGVGSDGCLFRSRLFFAAISSSTFDIIFFANSSILQWNNSIKL